MSVGRWVRRFSTVCAPALLATGLLSLAAAPAEAQQYTLTFDNTGGLGNPCSGTIVNNCIVKSNYGSVSGVNADGPWAVTASNGFSSTLDGSFSGSQDVLQGSFFGQSTPPNNYVATASVNDATSGFGAFDFTDGGAGNASQFLTLDSLRIGEGGQTPTHDIYEDIYVYSNSNVLLDKDSVIVTPADVSGGGISFLISGSELSGAADVAGGFKIYFGEAPCSALGTCTGALAGLSADPISPHYFSIDNITYESEAVAPEPGTLALFGTGLLGLAPMVLRRRRRKA